MELLWSSIGASCVCALLLLLLFLSHFSSSQQGAQNKLLPLPPQPPSLPVIGHMHLFGKLPHQSLHLLSQTYGPLMLIRLGSLRLVIASSPDMAQQFLRNHDCQFASRPQTIASKIQTHNGQSIAFSPSGPLWQYLRKICTTELFSSKQVRLFAPEREEEVSHFLRSIREQCQSGKAISIHNELWSLAYNIICRMVMGQKPAIATKTQILKELLENAAHLTSELHIGDFFPFLKWMDINGLERRIKKNTGDLDAIFEEIIAGRRRIRRVTPGSPSKDLLDVLLSLCDESDEQYRLNDVMIKGVLTEVFMGATNTTALTIEWALAELLRCPRVMRRAQEELSSIVGLHRKVCEADIPYLPYLQAIVKEVFRVHPAAPILVPHFNDEACEVAGYAIPARTQVLVNVWAIGRDPQLWERPLEFYPERFLDTKIDVQGTNFKLIPFGSGRRICAGMTLGLKVVELQVASLIQSFEWRLPMRERAEEMDMTEEFKFSLPKAKHLVAVATPRLPASVFLE